jgi:hypothetical protein
MKLMELDNNEYEVFVDLDGVLVDFVEGVQRLIPDYSEAKYQADSKYRSMMWKTIGAHQKQGNEFWLELNPMQDASILWNYVKQYDPQILTATGGSGYGAGEQKKRWVSKHLGSNVVVNLTQRADEKAQHAGPNRILIDDKQKAIGPWEAAGGIGVLHTGAANTIDQLKKLGL